MRILHTSDLHLGRAFNGIPLDDDHQASLDQIVDAAITHAVDALIIAGDIFDRASPPASAWRLLNDFLARIATETTAAVILSAGNHDSGDRIGSMATLTDTRRALIRGVARAEERPLLLRDDYGLVAFSALPFCTEYAAREAFGIETLMTPEDVIRAQIAAARALVPDGARWVITAHAFVTGAQGSDSERPLARAGGVDAVSRDVFEGAHYVALGHLHRPQQAGAAHIRYSGAPLAFGFDEAGQEKSLCIVEIDETGTARVETVPFQPLRRVRTLRGRHADLLAADPSTDFIKAVLTDPAPVIDAMKRLRDIFPNTCELTYDRASRPAASPVAEAVCTGRVAPLALVDAFLTQVRDEGLRDDERVIVTAALAALRGREDAA